MTISDKERAEWRAWANHQQMPGVVSSNGREATRILRLLDALDAAETRAERAEKYLSEVMDQRTDAGLAADAASCRAQSESQRANEVSGHLMQMSVDLERVVEINHALKERAEKAEAALARKGTVRCPHCDFSSGQRGMDRCAKCDGTGRVTAVSIADNAVWAVVRNVMEPDA